MLVAEAVVVGHILLEVAVVLVAVVKAVIAFQVHLDQDQEYMHKMAQLTLAVAEVAVMR
jgi:NADH:ubiquinone oxidoreductase subunit K